MSCRLLLPSKYIISNTLLSWYLLICNLSLFNLNMLSLYKRILLCFGWLISTKRIL